MSESPSQRLSRLASRVESNRAQRARDKDRGQECRDRLRMINDAPHEARTGFWCVECARDVVAWAGKITQRMDTQRPRAYYQAFCPKQHRLIRRITDKQWDPYYHQSRIMRMERARQADDMLQPDDPRFRQVYPEVWKKMEAEREAAREQADTQYAA